jgi:uncharacterized protein (TIGR00251 family)
VQLPSYLSAANAGADTLIDVKVVPGASSAQIAGTLGDRLRVRVTAPPERGRANEELTALLARSLGLRPGDVTVLRGTSQPRKSVLVKGLVPETVAERLRAQF